MFCPPHAALLGPCHLPTFAFTALDGSWLFQLCHPLTFSHARESSEEPQPVPAPPVPRGSGGRSGTEEWAGAEPNASGGCAQPGGMREEPGQGQAAPVEPVPAPAAPVRGQGRSSVWKALRVAVRGWLRANGLRSRGRLPRVPSGSVRSRRG